jgi:hypothetical protein
MHFGYPTGYGTFVGVAYCVKLFSSNILPETVINTHVYTAWFFVVTNVAEALLERRRV